MSKHENHSNIDRILRDWPYEPESVSVRLVPGEDGREVIQMRIEMGVLQLETEGRPDGSRPGGAETYYDHLVSLTVHEGEDFRLSEDHCFEIDREFVQFYHRRVCWLALRQFERAVSDADHTLGLMDLCTDYSPDEEWAMAHEQYRPFVLFHRTQAAALRDLDRDGPEAAVQAVNAGLSELERLYHEYEVDEPFEDNELVARLIELRESLREKFSVGNTLQEQLDEAVAAEKYELAAELRDKIAQRHDHRH